MKTIKLSRTIVVTLLLTVMGSILVIGTISIIYSNYTIKEQIKKKNSLLVQSLTSQINEYIELTYSNVISITQILDNVNMSTLERQFYLESFLKSHQRILPISDIHIIDTQGLILQTAPYNNYILGTDVSLMQYFKGAKKTKKPYWSGTAFYHHATLPLVTLTAPLKKGILAVHISLWNIESVIKDLVTDSKSIICIIDQQGTYIAHSDHKKVLERQYDPHHLLLKKQGTRKLNVNKLIYDNKTVVSFSQFIPSTEWIVNIYQPEEDLYIATQTLTTFFITSFFIILTCVLSIAYIQLNRIKFSLFKLMEFIQSISKEAYETPLPSLKFTEFDKLAQQFHSMSKIVKSREEQLKENEEIITHSLLEKETLLKEIHHRVKNNMQIISSLLEMQKEETKGKELDALGESQNRIQAMAFIHEQIYQSKHLSRVEFKDFTQHMIQYYDSTMFLSNRNIQFINNIKNIQLELEQAIPCALLLNELVTNSIKHAFKNNKEGKVTINFTLNKKNREYTLQVMDNGKGFTKGKDILLQNSLGINLLHALTTQLNGTIESEISKGVDISITFPKVSAKT